MGRAANNTKIIYFSYKITVSFLFTTNSVVRTQLAINEEICIKLEGGFEQILLRTFTIFTQTYYIFCVVSIVTSNLLLIFAKKNLFYYLIFLVSALRLH